MAYPPSGAITRELADDLVCNFECKLLSANTWFLHSTSSRV